MANVVFISLWAVPAVACFIALPWALETCVKPNPPIDPGLVPGLSGLSIFPIINILVAAFLWHRMITRGDPS